METLEIAEQLAEPLRQEPYHFFTNNCLTKSARLKRALRAKNIPARVVGCIGTARARWGGNWFTIPVIHGWAEVEGKRIETSRPVGSPSPWGIMPAEVRPIVSLRF